MRARVIAAAGLAGALAMVPFGLALSAAGFEVNRYGELLAEQLTGSRRPGVLFVLHLAIGLVSAVPLALAAAVVRPGRAVLLVGGTVYGALYWLVVNAVTLPIVYGRPHPWTEGAASVLPSLLVHIVYGTAVAAVLAWSQTRRRGHTGRHHGSVCSLCPLLRMARRRRGPHGRRAARSRNRTTG